jgi:hypothetical protein
MSNFYRRAVANEDFSADRGPQICAPRESCRITHASTCAVAAITVLTNAALSPRLRQLIALFQVDKCACCKPLSG